MRLIPQSINLGPSNLKWSVPAVTLSILRGFAGLDKFGRWRPSVKGHGRRPTKEERAAAWAKFQPILDKAVSIISRWYMLPVVYFCALIIRPVCLVVARVRDAIARRKSRKLHKQLGIPWEY